LIIGMCETLFNLTYKLQEFVIIISFPSFPLYSLYSIDKSPPTDNNKEKTT
jgi:hypothetical protein